MPRTPNQFASVLPPLPDVVAELQFLLGQIPAGRVTTYGQLANALGSRHAAKWIANWLATEPSSAGCPTHRIVRADGSVGEYRTRTAASQIRELQAEGIEVAGLVVNLDRYGCSTFQSAAPLQSLAEWQSSLALQISLRTPSRLKRAIAKAISDREGGCLVAGVDVSYVSSTRAVAAYVLIDLATGDMVWSRTREQTISFPYISGFLALRELPALLPLLDEVAAAGKLADIILVDGHGILHPRRMGIASHLGVMTGLSTIGIGKTLSVGHVELKGIQPGEFRGIIGDDGEVIGTALRPAMGQKPVYYSPGHNIDLPAANQIVHQLSRQHRLPAPTYWADRLSRAAARLLM